MGAWLLLSLCAYRGVLVKRLGHDHQQNIERGDYLSDRVCWLAPELNTFGPSWP